MISYAEILPRAGNSFRFRSFKEKKRSVEINAVERCSEHDVLYECRRAEGEKELLAESKSAKRQTLIREPSVLFSRRFCVVAGINGTRTM